MEQLTYNMMFRWFVGLSMDAPVWDVTVFTKNRERLLRGDVAVPSCRHPGAPEGQALAVGRAFLGRRHVDRSVGDHEELQAERREWRAACARTERRADFRGKPRSNATHASTTDPDARLYNKAAGQAAKMALSAMC